MVESQLRVIYGDTDKMGVVYHANYFRFFEHSRNEYLRAKGARYRDLEAAGGGLPVVEAHCRYRSPARYDDLLFIRARITELRAVTLKFEYEIVREGDPTVLATGSTLHAYVDRSGRPARMPESWRAFLDEPKS